MLQAALEALETGLARRAAPAQVLMRAVESLREKMDVPEKEPSDKIQVSSTL